VKLTLEIAVEKIAQLPRIFISKEFRELAQLNQKVQEGVSQAVDSFDFYHESKSLWLRHLVLKEGLASKAINSDRKYFQPHAELSNNLLELIRGFHPRGGFLQQGAFPPQEEIIGWWLICETIKAEDAFTTSGILGQSTILGKREFRKNNSTVIASLEESIIENNLVLTEIKSTSENKLLEQTTIIDFNKDPEGYIAHLAAQEASQNQDFDRQFWKPYIKRRRFWDRKIDDCSVLQLGCILPDGKLFITGHRQKLPISVGREL
jgi:hypothetical protein